MKLKISRTVAEAYIQRRTFISREEYDSLTYGDVLKMTRYAPILDCLIGIQITIEDFYEDEEGNGYVCGTLNSDFDGEEYYVEKLVSPNLNNLK